MNYEAIGIFHCGKENPYEAARQASLDLSSPNAQPGYVQLPSGKNFEQALERLNEFSHLWLIYEFHRNSHWKPKVLPPRGSTSKVGVFATRSPYRPNPIGMSCVKLKEVRGLQIFVESFDLLDQTPILDIKPYLAYADSFPEANNGWIRSHPLQLEWSELVLKQLSFLRGQSVPELQGFIQNQLSEEPLNSRKKRVWSTESENLHVLAYRTWRVLFSLNEDVVQIREVQSGYSQEDLLSEADKYGDKKSHRNFISQNWTKDEDPF